MTITVYAVIYDWKSEIELLYKIRQRQHKNRRLQANIPHKHRVGKSELMP